MTTVPNIEAAIDEILTNAGARECGRCGQLASVPARAGSEIHRQLWFCFECGNEEEHSTVPHEM
jgi:hypothetical protein